MARSDSAPTRTRSTETPVLPLRVYLWVGLAAVVVRLVYLTEHASSPFFGFPVLDELYYDTVARLLAAGDSVTGINPGFRPLFYPWLLSLLYRLGGDEGGRLLAVVAQHALGVGTALLVVSVGYRTSRSVAVAAIAGLLFALAGPPLYFEGELLITSLITFLVVLLLRHLAGTRIAAAEAADWPRWAMAGVLLGVAAQARPNALLVALALPAALFFASWGSFSSLWRRRSLFLLPAAGFGGLLAVLVVSGWLQRPHFGVFQLTTSSGGVNLYLGNKRGADGMVPRQDRAVSYGARYRDSVEVFAREEFPRRLGEAQPTPARISRYWLTRAGEEIAAAPGGWLGLMMRKTWFLVWSYEIPNNKTFGFIAREESALLSRLPVRWWMLVALSPLGIWALARGRFPEAGRDTLFWLLSYGLLWGLGLVLFFVNSRYRIPLWPAACVIAAGGLVWLVEAYRERRWRRAAIATAAAAATAAFSLVNWAGAERSDFSRDYFYRSLANLERGELDAATADARRAAEIDPGEAVYVYQTGATALAAERFSEAAAAFRAAGQLKPSEPRVWNDLGVALEAQGLQAEAYANYRKAIEQVADFPPALTNAALLDLRAGRSDLAAGFLERAERAGDDSVAYLCARAFLLRDRGEIEAGRRLLATARERNPAQTSRLEAENRLPLRLALEGTTPSRE